ncbi:O-methyltransferase MdmC [Tolypocladium ophioglossoides CBS 100239]|uniref:O-methyltransferase MdmC n=1 Tax=Tolypocladium ophioglossoides (strain CBS 100239) TaxID=1163406 RepID=A0A0L0MWD2_TOLOC|nr:O-methyltransferase MdmC [Tolypocladium ophioglossoides CBS 100239]
MKDESPILYPNERVGERISAYAKAYTTGIPKHIIEYHGHIRETMPKTANYMVSISQAQAMLFLTKTFGAKRILEVGVYVGLSSLIWSHAVGPDGQVTGLEFDPSFAKSAEEAFQKQGVKNVQVIVGDALETLPTLAPTEPYDMIFIDAQKSGYPEYLNTILKSSQPGSQRRLLRQGGLILGDNILRCGFVADDSEDNPWREFDFGPQRREYWKSEDIKALRRYNEIVSKTDRLENWLCPLWDGVNISRLLD